MTNTLILLMGTNPLPNYLAAQMLEWNQLFVFYTTETAAVNKLFIETLKQIKARTFTHTEALIRRPTDAASIRQTFLTTKAPGSSHLHYSGGTKVMTVHLHRCWLDAGGHPSRASYLDSRRQVLRFDDGRKIGTKRAQLDLETLLTLHGVEEQSRTSAVTLQAPTMQDALSMARWLIPARRSRHLIAELHRKVARFDDTPLTAIDLPDLGQPQIPGQGWTLAQSRSWSRFLRGTWLEFWIRDRLLATGTVKPDQLRMGLELERQGRAFEVDLAFLFEQNLYVVSCTTRRKMEPCKAKLFEIALRARQMGGMLARSALVCFLDGEDDAGRSKAELLQRDARDVWGAPNTPRVFGLQDLRSWLGSPDQPPDLSCLIEWLEG